MLPSSTPRKPESQLVKPIMQSKVSAHQDPMEGCSKDSVHTVSDDSDPQLPMNFTWTPKSGKCYVTLLGQFYAVSLNSVGCCSLPLFLKVNGCMSIITDVKQHHLRKKRVNVVSSDSDASLMSHEGKH